KLFFPCLVRYTRQFKIICLGNFSAKEISNFPFKAKEISRSHSLTDRREAGDIGCLHIAEYILYSLNTCSMHVSGTAKVHDNHSQSKVDRYLVEGEFLFIDTSVLYGQIIDPTHIHIYNADEYPLNVSPK